MNENEIIDIFDEEGVYQGMISREEAEAENHTTQNVIIFLFNQEGKVWVQLRSKSKKHFPGRWDPTACGGIHGWESPEQAAKREVLEETGLEVELIKAETFLNVYIGDNGETRTRISHEYIGYTEDAPISDGVEVDEFKLWEPGELKKDIRSNPEKYVPPLLRELEIALRMQSS